MRLRVGPIVDRASVEILIFGTGARMELVPSRIRGYMKEFGIQMDVMDTVGARSWLRCCGLLTLAFSIRFVLEERMFNV